MSLLFISRAALSSFHLELLKKCYCDVKHFYDLTEGYITGGISLVYLTHLECLRLAASNLHHILLIGLGSAINRHCNHSGLP